MVALKVNRYTRENNYERYRNKSMKIEKNKHPTGKKKGFCLTINGMKNVFRIIQKIKLNKCMNGIVISVM